MTDIITAIFSVTIQTGMDEYTTYHNSKVFNSTATIQEIEIWAKSIYQNITFFDIKFASLDQRKNESAL